MAACTSVWASPVSVRPAATKIHAFTKMGMLPVRSSSAKELFAEGLIKPVEALVLAQVTVMGMADGDPARWILGFTRSASLPKLGLRFRA